MADANALGADERRTLAAVLDEILPPGDDGRLPGAGEAGVGDFVESRIAERPELGPLLRQGLAAVDELARRRGAAGFADLDPAQRRPLLDEAAAGPAPALVGTLVFLGYLGYYQLPRVLEGLGLEARPPWPRGYAVEPPDWDALLAPVRSREPFYRRP